MEIVPGVHLIDLGLVNCYLIAEPSGLSLIDCGIPGHEKKIKKYIRRINRSPREIKHVFITHSDADHVGSLASLKKSTGALVYASAIEAKAIGRGETSRQIRWKGLKGFLRKILSAFVKIRPVTVDKIIKEKDPLPVEDKLTPIETFGHTPGHLSYFLEKDRILFTGDSIISTKGKLYSSNPQYTWNREMAGIAFRKQANLKPLIVCPGHGKPVKDAEGKF
ncbi:MAG: MBL fold metallo-hydrolase [Spirochaetales bacterium]|nr:MBL fold metallo-hydrolase [Spirochaetales bacterium]